MPTCRFPSTDSHAWFPHHFSEASMSSLYINCTCDCLRRSKRTSWTSCADLMPLIINYFRLGKIPFIIKIGFGMRGWGWLSASSGAFTPLPFSTAASSCLTKQGVDAADGRLGFIRRRFNEYFIGAQRVHALFYTWLANWGRSWTVGQTRSFHVKTSSCPCFFVWNACPAGLISLPVLKN